MQVAMSQRPHPPPVPPRPSRQVVAEAMKRSPRPPCPTRQAPPPPNTKPWRSEDHEVVAQERGGRTVVYESLKESSASGTEVSRCLSEPRGIEEGVRSEKASLGRRGGEEGTFDRLSIDERSNKSVACKIGKEYGIGSKKIVDDVAASERQHQVENHRERQSSGGRDKKCEPQARSNGGERDCDWENCSVKRRENGDDRSRDIRKESALIPADKHARNEEIGKKVELPFGNIVGGDRIDENEGIGQNSFESLDTRVEHSSPDENRSPNLKDMEKSARSFNATKIPKDPSKSIANNLFPPGTLGINTQKISMTPANKINNVDNQFDLETKNIRNPDSPFEKEDSPLSTRNNSTATISSDDCTTVVVIDEPERRISFNDDNDNIHHQDWLEAGVRYSSTKITLPGDENVDRNDSSSLPDDDDDPDPQDYQDDQIVFSDRDFASIRERIAMSSLQGLPPLPRSLSGFNLNEGRREAGEPPPPPTRSSSKTPKNVKSSQPSGSRPSPPGRQLTTLDTQLAILRKEMFGLRQLDLSLLSQLWSLNESIQEFRQLLQEQEDRAPSPSPSSEEGDDMSYGSHPPPPPRRPAPLLHHHRPPRPPRPLRPPASDESPSSEEYGAV